MGLPGVAGAKNPAMTLLGQGRLRCLRSCRSLGTFKKKVSTSTHEIGSIKGAYHLGGNEVLQRDIEKLLLGENLLALLTEVGIHIEISGKITILDNVTDSLGLDLAHLVVAVKHSITVLEVESTPIRGELDAIGKSHIHMDMDTLVFMFFVRNDILFNVSELFESLKEDFSGHGTLGVRKKPTFGTDARHNGTMGRWVESAW